MKQDDTNGDDLMKKLKITVAAVALASLGGTAWFYQRADGKEAP